MRRTMLAAIAAMTGAAMTAGAALAQDVPTVPPPAAMVIEQAPAVPAALAAETRPYLESRSVGFVGWNPLTGHALITTRFANVAQLHDVAMPLGMRQQISFEADRIADASYARRRGDVLVVQKDVGGSEFWQLYTLQDGRLTLLTDGKSRNQLGPWSHDGAWFAYTSTRRTGSDNDIYIMDPRDPASDRLVARVSGGGWSVLDIAPDARWALVGEYKSVTQTDLWRMDVKTGAMQPIGDHTARVAIGDARFAADGTLWIVSDEGSDFQRLGTLDPASGRFTPLPGQPNRDVESFDLSEDGRMLAFVINEAGVSRLKLLDTATRTARDVSNVPTGVIGGLSFSASGTLGFTLSSATAPSDLYSLAAGTLALTRWTQSETGGLDPAKNVAPELVSVKSFDGTAVSGFLYRPDPARFPGRRPLIVDIHGGPEGQARPGFRGSANYLLNELGIAIFYPNVRGSTGFGKAFVAMDDGPFKREDSLKDIGAFLDRLDADPRIDAKRVAVQGGSYGGYMCYAAAIRYGTRLRAANCAVAISNFISFLANTQGYRRDLRRVEYGDERVPAQRAKLIAISPLTRARELRIPLMVATGGNDPRVPPSEAAQMVAAVRANGVPAWHVLARDEGHGYAKRENADYLFWTSMMFWRANLLAEPR